MSTKQAGRGGSRFLVMAQRLTDNDAHNYLGKGGISQIGNLLRNSWQSVAAASEIDVEYRMFGVRRFLPSFAPSTLNYQPSTLFWFPAPYAY